MSALRWVGEHWRLPLLILIGVIGFALWTLLGKRLSRPPFERVQKELNAIEAQREARSIQLHHGAEDARQYVKAKYKARLETLDAQASTKAKELEDDPVALARYLERLTRHTD